MTALLCTYICRNVRNNAVIYGIHTVWLMPPSERFELRLDPAILERIDRWRGSAAGSPSRAAAIRQLVEVSLDNQRDDALFQIMRLQVLQAAEAQLRPDSSLAPGENKYTLGHRRFSDAYIFAWKTGVYPALSGTETFHVPFARSFGITRDMVMELDDFLGKASHQGRHPTFYEVETHFNTDKGYASWDRISLMHGCRYLWLESHQDRQVGQWADLLIPGQYPVEARTLLHAFSLSVDVPLP
jgi:antitoxin MazE